MAYNKKQALVSNILAIETAFRLHRENRPPTESERFQLQNYTGFGGLGVIMNDTEDLSRWSKEDLQLLPAVTHLWSVIDNNAASLAEAKDMRASLKNSVLTAFYTPQDFIDILGAALYKVMGRLPEKVLEPSAGSGRFMHLFDKIEGGQNVKWSAFEKDKLTGLVLKGVEPDARVCIRGFETAGQDMEGSFDMVVSNIPFADVKVFDPQFARSKDPQKKAAANKLHTYFFAKGLDMVRDGGLVAYITSRGVADTPANRSIREYMVTHADLVTGIRLPDNLFTDDGITSVGTDLLIFQRNDAKQELSEDERAFIETVDYVLMNKGSESYPHIVPDTDRVHARNAYFNQPFTAEDMEEKKRGVGLPVGGKDRFGKPAVIWSMREYADYQSEIQTWQEDLAALLERDLTKGYRRIEPKPEAVVETPQERTDRNLAGEQLSLWDLFGMSDEERTQIKTTGRRRTKGKASPAPGPVQPAPKPVAEHYEPDGELYKHYKPGAVINYKDRTGIYQNAGERTFTPLDAAVFSDADRQMLALYSDLRDCYWQLFDSERDLQIANNELRGKLNGLYDRLENAYGGLREAAVAAVCSMDPHYSEIAALEKYVDGQKVKADIFNEPVNIIEKDLVAEDMSAHEALAASLNLFGNVDVDFMVDHTGMEFRNLRRELYEELLYDPVSESWKEKNTLVCDNIYEKIDEIGDCREDFLRGLEDERQRDEMNAEINHTLEVMEASKPKLIEFEELDFNLGERWIPLDYYNEFFNEFLDGKNFNLTYIEAADEYHFTMDWNYKIEREWSVRGRGSDLNAKDVFNAAMVNNVPEMTYTGYDDAGNKIKLKDTDAMQLCAAKIENLRSGFEDWLGKLPVERKDELTQLYNKRFNCFVRPHYDGSHQTFPGLTFEQFDYDDLYPSQKDAIWMIKQNGGGICDHEVGAGKTMIMCCAAMEMKRLGLANKPMIIGLKANVHEIAATFRKAYPQARVLYPSKKDFEKANRMEFFRDIANNNYDCIILSHEQFEKIPQSLEVQRDIFNQEKQEVSESLNVLKQSGARYDYRKLEKGLEKRLENLTVKLNELQMSIQSRNDDIVDFHSMGIDHILVDESHQFKNLMVQTRQNRVAGLGNVRGSQRAMQLFFAIRDIQQRTGRDLGATFLSGTTISNSLTELYVLFKYLRPEALRRQNINCFDAWSAVFTRKSTEFEFNVTNQVVQKERFRYFVKVPELAQFYNQITDYRTAAMVGIDRPQRNAIFKSIQPSPDQEDFIHRLMEFAQSGNGELVGLGRLEDSKIQAKMLIATNLSNKMALDMRLIDPFKYQDTAGGKVDVAAETIYDYYVKYNEHKGTQFVFGDLGTYKPNEWNVYSAIKDKLVNTYGIPENEIAFIQQHNTDKRKAEVIAAMNRGDVRVIFGSTQMLGTGVNAQQRAVALHHLDAPWRPSDLEQREGRAVRKGNIVAKQFAGNKVDIITYATERSLDAYKFNLLHNKQMFISQLKSRQLGARSLDEGGMDESGSVPFAEYVAILSGNTDLLDRAKLDKQVKQLERERLLYNRETSSLERERVECGNYITNCRKTIDDINLDHKAYVQHRQADEGFISRDGTGLIGVEVGRYINGIKAGLKPGDNVRVGTYMGMQMYAGMGYSGAGARFHLKGIVSGKEYTRDNGVFPVRFADGEQWLKGLAESFPARTDRLLTAIVKTENRIAEIGELLSDRKWGKEDQLSELKVQLAVLDEKIRQALDEAKNGQNKENEDVRDIEDAVVVEEPALTEDKTVEKEQEQQPAQAADRATITVRPVAGSSTVNVSAGPYSHIRTEERDGKDRLLFTFQGHDFDIEIKRFFRSLIDKCLAKDDNERLLKAVEAVSNEAVKDFVASKNRQKEVSEEKGSSVGFTAADIQKPEFKCEVKMTGVGRIELIMALAGQERRVKLDADQLKRYTEKQVTALDLAREVLRKAAEHHLGGKENADEGKTYIRRGEQPSPGTDGRREISAPAVSDGKSGQSPLGPDTTAKQLFDHFSQFIGKPVTVLNEDGSEKDRGNVFKVAPADGIRAAREGVSYVTVYYRNPARPMFSLVTLSWKDADRIRLQEPEQKQDVPQAEGVDEPSQGGGRGRGR